jgi:DNA-binding NarL/FixJ family response regulator
MTDSDRSERQSRYRKGPSRLMLVDDNRAFRAGLRIWLEQFSDLEVIAEAGDGAAALQALATHEMDFASSIAIDLIILDLGLGSADPEQIQGLDLCRQIHSQYPAIAILLLSSMAEPVMLAAARRSGAKGYCPKQTDATELAAIIRQIARGGSRWVQPTTDPSAAVAPSASGAVRSQPAPKLPAPFTVLRRNLRRSGLQQIEAALSDVTNQLQNLDLSLLDRAILAGRQRELRTSRWLVRQLLATPTLPESLDAATPRPEAPPPGEQQSRYRESRNLQPEQTDAAQLPRGTELAVITPSESGLATARNLQIALFDAIAAKLQSSLQNQTSVPLEIDILREEKKRELLYLVLRKLEELLDELRFSQVQPGQLEEKRSPILQDLWQIVVTDYFGKYYTILLGSAEIEVVSVLLQDLETVQNAILNKIPFVSDLLSHLLFQTPLIIEGNPYIPGSPEAMRRGEAILENLLIQVANAVVQPLLNRFANVETIKQNFYEYRLLSVREVERFRNNLSWKYRLEKYIGEPRAIFESQYSLFILYGSGIQKIAVYAPRAQELEQLSGLPFTITLALETRDAIAPRFRSAISFVGSGLIYVLTEVIGRGIGLIGRGILKGVGSAWQDGKYSRNERQK